MQRRHLFKSAAFNQLACLPTKSQQAIRKESCWTISNITAGNREQIQEACGAFGAFDAAAERVRRVSCRHEVINNGLLPPAARRHRRQDALICPVRSRRLCRHEVIHLLQTADFDIKKEACCHGEDRQHKRERERTGRQPGRSATRPRVDLHSRLGRG